MYELPMEPPNVTATEGASYRYWNRIRKIHAQL